MYSNEDEYKHVLIMETIDGSRAETRIESESDASEPWDDLLNKFFYHVLPGIGYIIDDSAKKDFETFMELNNIESRIRKYNAKLLLEEEN